MKSIPFDEKNLFPLLDSSQHDYRDAQIHSAKVDEFLKLRIAETERQISATTPPGFESKEKWVGLDPQALQTPYTEIRTMLLELNLRDEFVIDLGAGYGRMAWVIGTHYPQARFIGYEISKERVEEGCRCLNTKGFSNTQLVQQDLTDPEFRLPLAQIYFLYDFGTPASIQKVLHQLQEHARKTPLIVIGRGRGVRDRIERHEFWLSDVVPPQHCGNFSIYRTR